METTIVSQTTACPIMCSLTVREKRRIYKAPKRNRILVVEDDRFCAEIVAIILKDLRCDVDVAASGGKALELLAKNSYGLVLMDIGLPDMDGYEVTRRIRTTENDTGRHTPIIALSAHIESSYRQKCMEAGMDDALTKPLQRKQAIDVLNRFIPDRRDRAQSDVR